MYNQYYTYIMSNHSNSTLYIGVTNDMERRVQEHKSGLVPGFTQKYKCNKLVYYELFSDINQAIDREKQLKKWSRVKKELLIDSMNKERKDLYKEEISPRAALGRNDKSLLVISSGAEGGVEKSISSKFSWMRKSYTQSARQTEQSPPPHRTGHSSS